MLTRERRKKKYDSWMSLRFMVTLTSLQSGPVSLENTHDCTAGGFGKPLVQVIVLKVPVNLAMDVQMPQKMIPNV